MDREAWRATVRGVAKSQTRLSNSHTHTHTHTLKKRCYTKYQPYFCVTINIYTCQLKKSHNINVESYVLFSGNF